MSKKILLFAFLAVLFITACQPYEEGPKMSFRSKNARFEQTWILKNIINQDGSESSPSIDITYQFKSGGELLINTDGAEQSAEWEFSGETELILKYSETFEETYKIKRLSKSDLWLEEVNGQFENHFISKN